MDDGAPWPGQIVTSSAKAPKMRSSIEAMMVAKFPPSKVVLPGPPGNKVSPVNSSGVFSRAKQMLPGVCPGRVDRAKAEVPDGVDRVVLEEMVVAREEMGVFVAHPDVDARFAHRLDGANVIEMSVGLEDRSDPEALGHAQQALVLIGGVDQGGFAASSAAHHVDIVCVITHHEAMNLARGVRPDQLDVIHTLQTATNHRQSGSDYCRT